MRLTTTLLFFQVSVAPLLLASAQEIPRDDIPFIHFAFQGYEEPPYFQGLENTLDANYAKRCVKRESPPEEGSSCRRRPKTCFWGSQTCPDGGGEQPETRCICKDKMWTCKDYQCPQIAECPAEDPSMQDFNPVCADDLICSYNEIRCCDEIFDSIWCICEAGQRIQCYDVSILCPGNPCSVTQEAVTALGSAASSLFPADVEEVLQTLPPVPPPTSSPLGLVNPTPNPTSSPLFLVGPPTPPPTTGPLFLVGPPTPPPPPPTSAPLFLVGPPTPPPTSAPLFLVGPPTPPPTSAPLPLKAPPTPPPTAAPLPLKAPPTPPPTPTPPTPGVPIGGDCNTQTQNCNNGLNCVVEDVFDGEPKCRTAGNDQTGDVCQTLGDNDGDSCDVGSICITAEGDNSGTCLQLATNEGCEDPDYITHTYPSGATVCERECDPIVASSCQNEVGYCTREVGSQEGRFSCFDGEGRGIAEGCVDDYQCNQNGLCIDQSALPFGYCDDNAAKCCSYICETDNNPNCVEEVGESLTCETIWGFLNPLPSPALATVGVCTFP